MTGALSRQERTSLRILTLTLYLSATNTGYTRRQLQELVAGYENLTDRTFQRTFERDLAALRESGFEIELVGQWPDYRYRPARARARKDVALTSAELDLLLRALRVWGSIPPVEVSRLHLKLSSYLAPGESPAVGHAVKGNLEGAEHVVVLLEAISLRQPVSFEYHSRRSIEMRDVAPLSLLSRGTALYLWAYDFNREGERYFRLSRIRSDIELVAEPDCYEIPEYNPDEFGKDHFRVRPVLKVRSGLVPLIEMRLEPGPAETTDGEWAVRQGKAADWATWERLVIRHAENVIPLAPASFKNRLEQLITDAANIEGERTGELGA